jgi:hypothetical protein
MVLSVVQGADPAVLDAVRRRQSKKAAITTTTPTAPKTPPRAISSVRFVDEDGEAVLGVEDGGATALGEVDVDAEDNRMSVEVGEEIGEEIGGEDVLSAASITV